MRTVVVYVQYQRSTADATVRTELPCRQTCIIDRGQKASGTDRPCAYHTLGSKWSGGSEVVSVWSTATVCEQISGGSVGQLDFRPRYRFSAGGIPCPSRATSETRSCDRLSPTASTTILGTDRQPGGSRQERNVVTLHSCSDEANSDRVDLRTISNRWQG